MRQVLSASAGAAVEHDRVSLNLRDALVFGQALDLVNDVVWFVEVDTDGPFVVALGRDAIVKIADLLWLGEVDGELFDSLVANRSDLSSLFMEANLLDFDHRSDLVCVFVNKCDCCNLQALMIYFNNLSDS